MLAYMGTIGWVCVLCVVLVRLWGCLSAIAIFCYMLQLIGLCDDMAVDKLGST